MEGRACCGVNCEHSGWDWVMGSVARYVHEEQLRSCCHSIAESASHKTSWHGKNTELSSSDKLGRT